MSKACQGGRLLYATLVIVAALPACGFGDYLDDIGYRPLATRPGALQASGAGVSVAQVEAESFGGYSPDQLNGQFAGKTFTLHDVPAQPTSVHATDVALHFYGGLSSVAPQVSRIHLFNDTSLLDALNTGTKQNPAKLGVSVMNISWIASAEQPAANAEILRRFDYLINRDNLVGVTAVDNGAASRYPRLMASGYNTIAVGISGGSSHGPASFDGQGKRAKPDLIVPLDMTSRAAAVVSGASALLLSEAKVRGMPTSALAAKAMLMAGAQHLPGWHRGGSGTKDDLRVPLDYTQGAGELRVDRSFAILAGGRQRAGATVSRRGWDLGSLKSGQQMAYPFKVTSASGPFSSVLTWNRRFALENRTFVQRTPILANLDLSLQRKDKKVWHTITRSASTTDNLETLWRAHLDPGLYRITITGDRAEHYALAWNVDSADVPASIPLNSVPLSDYAATNGPAFPPGNSAIAVPEPSLGLTALPLAWWLVRRRSPRISAAAEPKNRPPIHTDGHR